MVYLIAQYYELVIGEVLKQWPAVIQIAFSPDNLAESWFQLIFFLGGLAWFLIKRPLSKQKVVGTMDVMDDFNRALYKCRNSNKKQVCTADSNFAQDSPESLEDYKR